MDTNTAHHIRVSAFTFEPLAASERFEVWKDMMKAMGMEVSLVKPTPSGPFHAKGAVYHLPSTLMTHYSCSSQFLSRPRPMIAQDDLEYFGIQAHLNGTATGQWGKESHIMRAGDIMFVDMARPFQAVAENPERLFLIIPRKMLARQFPRMELHHGKVLPRKSVFGQLLGNHLHALRQLASGMTAEEAEVAGQGMADLVGHYFNQAFPQEGNPNLDATYVQTLRHYILRHLADPELNPERIAAHFRMSRSYLYRLFASQGGISSFILEQRLLRAFKLLSSPTEQHRRISDIAYALGFSSNEHFSRSFRRYFGMTPSDVRASILLDKPSGQAVSTLDLSHIDWIHQRG